ncbi:hypothetical protein SFOMI_4444 [Sphingobium fuliginis]|nr:hypothetical protein SFOMI_4444 [Sphingobium fuliginis]
MGRRVLIPCHAATLARFGDGGNRNGPAPDKRPVPMLEPIDIQP